MRGDTGAETDTTRRRGGKDDYEISGPATQRMVIYTGTRKTWRTLKKKKPPDSFGDSSIWFVDMVDA